MDNLIKAIEEENLNKVKDILNVAGGCSAIAPEKDCILSISPELAEQPKIDEGALTPLGELELAKEYLSEFCGWCDGLVLGAKIEEPRILAEVKVMLCNYVEYLEEKVNGR